MAYLLLREYRWPIALAILLHIGLLLLFSFSINKKHPTFSLTENQNNFIRAVAIDAIPSTISNKPLIVKPETFPLQTKPILKSEPELIKTEPNKPIVKKLANEKSALVIKQQVIKGKETSKTKPQSVLKTNKISRLLEVKQTMDENKQKAALLAKQQQAKTDQLFQEQLKAEQKELDMATQLAAMQGEIDKYKGLILQAIAQHWLVPHLIDKNLSCKLLIRLAPGGMVISAKLTQTSGDPALDRSALAAVYKASPLPVPNEPLLFDKFRDLSLTVYPQAVS